MRYYGGGQTDQDEVLDDCCHVISASELSACDFRFKNSPLVTLLHSSFGEAWPESRCRLRPGWSFLDVLGLFGAISSFSPSEFSWKTQNSGDLIMILFLKPEVLLTGSLL